jgi:hypothetical protein
MRGTLSAPVYRAPVAPDVFTTAVPAEVAAPVRANLGIAAETVTIHRGRSVTQRAEALGARAFTQQGQVFLPDEAGSLDQRDTQALLVHELVHAAQQRALGAELPTEESAAGQKLEADAVAAEQWFLGDGPVQPPTAGFRETDLTDVLDRLDGLDTQVAALKDQPAFDPEDARVLDRLAGRLYRYLRSRLRAELIVDRERSGLLADLSMRGVR